VLFVHDPQLAQFDFGPDHPLRPVRHELLVSLLEHAGVLKRDSDEVLNQQPATHEELLLVHTPDYVSAVARLSELDGVIEGFTGEPSIDPERYGFGLGDTPTFPGMHDVCARIAGGTLAAARAVMSGQVRHAFNPTGGLHHAMRDRASGFCIYNDTAVAIAALLRDYEAHVLYVDFDAHHGDGVQWAFYDEPRVMTVSFHETGRYLFPGTGDVLELGQGAGRGFAVNLPMDAFTEDGSWLEAINAMVPALAERFRPDIIFSQHGCDPHTFDPLTHLATTTRAAAAQAKLIHDLAHEHCQGRWVALGGGGYDIYRVVPRAWSLVWSELSGRTLPDKIPTAWLDRWQPECPDPLPRAFLDDPDDFPPKPRRAEIERHNRRVVAQARRLFLPAQVRQAFPAVRPEAPGTDVRQLLGLVGRPPEARTKTLETPKGQVLLSDWCSPAQVEQLRPDEVLRSFLRSPDREQALLKRISERPDSELVLAHTPDGLLIGQVSISAAEGWWDGIGDLYEVAIEVSSNWRKLGLASELLMFALEPEYFEHVILLALGYAWHWDLEETGLGSMGYSKMIRGLFQKVGFEPMHASEPNLHLDPANVFLARIGANAHSGVVALFRTRLGSPASFR
jgi:acetoin utilization deacetylase AcuC-like enzyme/GNAT superfamily N-acetyltransferase